MTENRSLTRVTFRSEADLLLLPMNESFTNGVKTARVLQLRQGSSYFVSSPDVRSDTRSPTIRPPKPPRRSKPSRKGSATAVSRTATVVCNITGGRAKSLVDRRDYKCNHCDRRFVSRSALIGHVAAHSTTNLRVELENALYGRVCSMERYEKLNKKIQNSPKCLLKKHLKKTVSTLRNILRKS